MLVVVVVVVQNVPEVEVEMVSEAEAELYLLVLEVHYKDHPLLHRPSLVVEEVLVEVEDQVWVVQKDLF